MNVPASFGGHKQLKALTISHCLPAEFPVKIPAGSFGK
jgi:hypothetical protein